MTSAIKKTILGNYGGSKIRDTYLPYGKQCVDENDIAAVTACLKDPYLTTGPRVKQFEDAVAKFVGAKHAIAVCNGTASLHACVAAAGIGPGDEVIVGTMTFASTPNAVRFCGGTVVFADCDPDTMNIDVKHVESLITEKTKAVMGIDMCGQPCDLEALADLCMKHNLVFIEDAAHSIGAVYKGKRIGTVFSHMASFSFHPVKNFTTGEGGMVVTNSDHYAKILREFRSHGIDTDYKQRMTCAKHRYNMAFLGYNYRITDIQCALGTSQLEKLPGFLKRRNEIAELYNKAFSEFDFISPVELLKGKQIYSAYHIYVIRLNLETLTCDRDEFFACLRAENIGVNVHYLPTHKHSYYQELHKFKEEPCPKAVALYQRIITLPIFPLMTDQDVQDVINACKKIGSVYHV